MIFANSTKRRKKKHCFLAMHVNKNEIKAYYQTHNEDLKELSKIYNIPLRTLQHWAKLESWEKGSAIKGIAQESLKNDLLKKEFGTAIALQSDKIQKQIEYNLGDTALMLDDLIKKNMLEDATQKLLLNAMSLNFIQQNIALSAMIAKNELTKMLQFNANNPKADPMIIASAQKVQEMLLDLKTALFGKDSATNTAQTDDLSNLSDAELNALLQN